MPLRAIRRIGYTIAVLLVALAAAGCGSGSSPSAADVNNTLVRDTSCSNCKPYSDAEKEMLAAAARVVRQEIWLTNDVNAADGTPTGSGGKDRMPDDTAALIATLNAGRPALGDEWVDRKLRAYADEMASYCDECSASLEEAINEK